MPVLSVLRRALPIKQSFCNTGLVNAVQLRNGHNTMFITPSRWSWHKFKDLIHFYVMLGVIPLSALVFYVNIFVGPAQLAEIPEGYYPEKWEYYKHPVCRWFAKNIYQSHQEEYEKYLHVLFEEHEKMEMRRISTKVKVLMRVRGDSTAYHYNPPVLEYMKMVRKEFEDEREYKTDI